MTSIDRTAYPRFKRMITTRELAGSFTPSNEEIEWARDMTLSDPHLLALTVWLKSYQRLGYFPKLDEVPQVVVEHVREALRLPADVEGRGRCNTDGETASRVRPYAAGGEVQRREGADPGRGGDRGQRRRPRTTRQT